MMLAAAIPTDSIPAARAIFMRFVNFIFCIPFDIYGCFYAKITAILYYYITYVRKMQVPHYGSKKMRILHILLKKEEKYVIIY